MKKISGNSLVFLLFLIVANSFAQKKTVKKIDPSKYKNVIFILTDDHRFDFMGFTGRLPWLKTPNMDLLAAKGAYFKNAFVTTSLCSPSRASILTGQYSHVHTVVDNVAPMPASLVFFPQYLQKAGYQTSFFGKWHMGNETDKPQKGFDHWESFLGQGIYYNPTLNIDGKEVVYKDSTYITDLLTNHAINWLKKRDTTKPFFCTYHTKRYMQNFCRPSDTVACTPIKNIRCHLLIIKPQAMIIRNWVGLNG